MKNFWVRRPFRSPLAVLAGFLLTLAFPKFSVAGFAWVAPGLMLAAALGARRGAAFRLGYLSGLAHYLSMLYWLLFIPYRWLGIPIGPAAGWLALSSFLALFPAFWVWLMAPSTSAGENSSGPQSPGAETPGQLGPVLPRTWVGRTVWALSGAAVWVGLEMVLARFLGGFPWDLLGVSQYRMVPLIQVASVTGVYGVSFLVVWGSLSLLSAGVMVVRRPTSRSVWVAEVFVPVLVVAGLFNLGLRSVRHAPLPARTLNVTFVQPSIPQTLIWNPQGDAQRFTELLRLSEQALTNPTDLLLWPEAALPKMLRYDTNTFDALTNLASRHHVWMIVGSDDAEPHPGATNPDDADYFNSSFLLGPDGTLRQRYVKRSLVIFGEYVPFQPWLPFLRYLVPGPGGFTPGTRAVAFRMPDLNVDTSVLICFEDVFPHLARGDVEPDTDFLVNITNDGWFGETAAPWQHAASALFRAVENRRPLLRCANNGLTCWIDAWGRLPLGQIFRDARGSVYGAGFMTAKIPLVSPEDRPTTFYTRHGDWFGWGCTVIAGALLLRRTLLRRGV